MTPTANTREIVLASASRARREILAAAGVAFTVEPANVDEPALREDLKARDSGAGPIAVAEMLARAKAEDVSKRHPGAMVIGADQVLAFEGQVLSKPNGIEAARKALQRLRAHTHELHAAVAFSENGKVVWTHTASASLTMRDFSDSFLDDYLVRAGDRVCQSVGAYELEGVGVQLFERIEGDYFTILGLPLLSVLKELRARSVIAQ